MEKPQEIQLATATQTRDASKLDSVPNFKSRFSFVKVEKFFWKFVQSRRKKVSKSLSLRPSQGNDLKSVFETIEESDDTSSTHISTKIWDRKSQPTLESVDCPKIQKLINREKTAGTDMLERFTSEKDRRTNFKSKEARWRESEHDDGGDQKMILQDSFLFSLDSDPVTFWRPHRDRFPLLRRIALHFLSPTQSSAIVERLFSVCGSIVNNSRRNRMKPKTLNQQLLCAALATLESTKKNTSTTEEYECDDENDDSEGEEYYESREHNDDTFGNDLAQIMKH
ncbi:Protein CBG15850 [Caenorhabditis briggsae]|uniref:Protein CBG15850 n=1 Tax=Caenorhabditis briggsae TaxID=6238 RepID=A8XMW3_CAEBR|nr:Protein CBG15850 [Caenorhabditis briggsae]CAP33988.1 Protein CBG15850 [Caenorhabditis briggsae]